MFSQSGLLDFQMTNYNYNSITLSRLIDISEFVLIST